MKVIDCHIHIGKYIDFDMPLEHVLYSMQKYGIDFALCSPIEGAEYDHEQKPILDAHKYSQLQFNQQMINIAKAFSDKLGALLWIKLDTQPLDLSFEQLIIDNRKYIYGLKFHPYHSVTSPNDDKAMPYLQLAQRHKLAVVSHTAKDFHSRTQQLALAAQKFPSVNFVAYHMDLGTDNNEAIELISSIPNLYGDLCWVSPKAGLRAIEICGSNKIMFGTDNPIDGKDTYAHEYYDFYRNQLKDIIGQKAYADVMCNTAKRVFGIPN